MCFFVAPVAKSDIMKTNIIWLRRDLRLNDNTALFQATKQKHPVQLIFIFDTDILNELPIDDARVTFIYEALNRIHKSLRQQGSSLKVYKGSPLEVWKKIINEFSVNEVFINEDYEPYGVKRDELIKKFLQDQSIRLSSFTDHVLLKPGEVLKSDGSIYTVFTPFKRKWLDVFGQKSAPDVHTSPEISFIQSDYQFPTMEALEFKPSRIKVPEIMYGNIAEYDKYRDLPGMNKTSRTGPHLRFGTISIRELLKTANTNEVYLSELIWREFFIHILYFNPHVVSQNFKPKYDHIQWENNEELFEQWCRGKTGFPLVDAGMRELNETGFMHNRVRMITASFLCKQLLIDWRWGEAYFAQKLLDYELASNNGNWQWVAGTGCDAAPYFRIFNPITQASKFDPKKIYIKNWIPEYDTSDYPEPIIELSAARERTLMAYKKALNA
jgi:deoxyribodipyrimidine photo-lyase